MTVHRSNPAALHGAPGFISQIVQATGPLAFVSGQVSQRVDGTWAGIGNHLFAPEALIEVELVVALEP